MPRLYGEQHPLHKLTTEDVQAIRASYLPGLITHAQLATQYSVTKQSIAALLARRTWRHLTDE